MEDEQKRKRGRPRKDESKVQTKVLEKSMQPQENQPEKPKTRDEIMRPQLDNQWNKVLADPKFRDSTAAFRSSIVKFYQKNQRAARETGDIIAFIKKGKSEKIVEPFHRVLNDALSMFYNTLIEVEYDKKLTRENGLRAIYSEFLERMNNFNAVYKPYVMAKIRERNGMPFFVSDHESNVVLFITENSNLLYEILNFVYGETVVMTGIIKKEEDESTEEINLDNQTVF